MSCGTSMRPAPVTASTARSRRGSSRETIRSPPRVTRTPRRRSRRRVSAPLRHCRATLVCALCSLAAPSIRLPMTTESFRTDLFAGKVALVVGATSGIGAAIADAFAGLGALVTVTGATRDETEAARSAPQFRCRDAVPLDVRDEAAVHALVDDLPRLDVLVNCAGIIRRGAE